MHLDLDAFFAAIEERQNPGLKGKPVIVGADPKFGARPINRAISDDVEQLVAKKIISGELKPGSQIVFNKEDFTG